MFHEMISAMQSNFYPRPLRGGRPGGPPHEDTESDFYPRPLRGGRPEGKPWPSEHWEISIHALCEEGDLTTMWTNSSQVSISIHALCEEGDLAAAP